MKRRDLLGLGGMTLVGATLSPASVRAQTAKRGGTITLRLWDPPHFDPYLQVSYKTHIVYSFTHSRLVKPKVGPAAIPGDFCHRERPGRVVEPAGRDYVHLQASSRRALAAEAAGERGELTAEDVVYSVERFRTSSATWRSSSDYVQLASAVNVAVWDRALKNYGPNLGFDWGGRLMAAWLDR